jgi:hypothetical protein
VFDLFQSALSTFFNESLCACNSQMRKASKLCSPTLTRLRGKYGNIPRLDTEIIVSNSEAQISEV